MIKHKKEIYILLLKLNDCYTCVAKGLADIQNLSRSGSNYICIIVHDSLDDIKGFAETFPEIIFHQIKTKGQYENIRCLYFPVIAKLNNKRIVNYRFITP